MPSSAAALRISTIVRGRHKEGPRVTYLLDPDGRDADRDVPESVVLTRWRRRRVAGFVHSGARLAPSLWRALPVALGPDVASWTSLSERTIADRLEAVRPALRAQHLDAPSAMIVHTLIAVCGPARLQQLVARHANPERWGSPGVPDLFLFRRDTTGRITSARFVEVKRPREPFRPGQEDELAFLQSIGLHARVLRLIERPLRSDSVADTSVTPPGEREA
jgi:hypothetical protein